MILYFIIGGFICPNSCPIINENDIDVFETKYLIRNFIKTQLGKEVDICSEKYLKPYVKDEILSEVIYVWGNGFPFPDRVEDKLHGNDNPLIVSFPAQDLQCQSKK